VLDRPVVRSDLHVEAVEPDGVYLLSERGQTLLKGELFIQLIPLLDGTRSADDIVTACGEARRPADVYYALSMLERGGHIVEHAPGVPRERSAFWQAMGLAPAKAEHLLAKAEIHLETLGKVADSPLREALLGLGLRIAPSGSAGVVAVDDYLHPGLARINEQHLAKATPWILVKPVGTELWIGPIFRPGHTACWACLAQRLGGNREVQSYVQGRIGRDVSIATSQAALPATVGMAAQAAALEAVKMVTGLHGEGVEITTIDTLTMGVGRHAVVRRPQCPVCGDPAAGRSATPRVTLRPQPKRFLDPGRPSVVSPEVTLSRLLHHVSPITGVVSSLTRVESADPEVMPTYVAGHNHAVRSPSLATLRHGLRNKSSGKGLTDIAARVSGLCEAIERYSGIYQGEEPRRRARIAELSDAAIHPASCLLFSERQYEQRRAINARGAQFDQVPEPFAEDAEADWTPVWSLSGATTRYVLTSYCYFGAPATLNARYCRADSNGCAAGNSVEEAVFHGLMELVERDAVAIWWYNRLGRPAVDLDGLGDVHVEKLRESYRRKGRDVWVLDLTGDLDIPVFAAVSRRMDAAQEQILFGFGAHLDPHVAILRSLTELNQCLLRAEAFAGRVTDDALDPDFRDWWRSATLQQHPWLAPDPSLPRRQPAGSGAATDDFLTDIQYCQGRLEGRGLELLVLDQTRPDVGLPCVRVIVPGLRHFWARFAPGRLYDVPVACGWLARALSEAELNPTAMFI